MNNKKTLWEILVPRASNEGKEFSVDYHRTWDRRVNEIAGGLTILRSAKGHWTSPEGRNFVEQMIPVRVYCRENEIDKIILYTMDYYKQEAVMAYEISRNVKLVHRKNKEIKKRTSKYIGEDSIFD
ncbi:MAG: hypothetical protein WCK90_06010 [archaeon]